MDTIAKRTLKLDLLRSIPLGLIESIATTFGVLVLVRVFDGNQFSKAWVVASLHIGLLLSLLVVQLVRKSGVSVSKVMCGLHLLSAFGFFLISINPGSLWYYVIGILIGALGLASSLPLMSQIYREHYPNENRGTLFAYGGFVRKVFAILGALVGGWLLQKDLDNFRILFGLFSVASIWMALVVLRFEEVKLDKATSNNLFAAFRHVKTDKEFKNLLVSWMYLGLGNLLCISLFVEYISNRVYGYDLSEFTIGMVTTFVPEAVYLLVVMMWGKAFDKWNFYLMRATLNLIFATGILIYFLGDGIWFLVAGMAIHGIAKSGGNVAWSLWINKLAQPQHVAEYMSVHTFLTGIRGVISPFIALPLALLIPTQWIAIIGACLILFATFMIAPNIKFQIRRRESEATEPDPRS